MKLLFLLLLQATLLICLNCCKDKEDSEFNPRYITFEVKNESGNQASIHLFKSDNSKFKSITLDTGQVLTIDSGVILRAPSSPTYHITSSKIDSAVIVFADKKTLIQTCCFKTNNDTINNILSTEFYQVVKMKEDEYKSTFLLTKADYLRAR